MIMASYFMNSAYYVVRTHIYTDSTLNEGTNSLLNELIGDGLSCVSHNEHHKTRNGWYSGMEAPIYSIVGRSVITEQ